MHHRRPPGRALWLGRTVCLPDLSQHEFERFFGIAHEILQTSCLAALRRPVAVRVCVMPASRVCAIAILYVRTKYVTVSLCGLVLFMAVACSAERWLCH